MAPFTTEGDDLVDYPQRHHIFTIHRIAFRGNGPSLPWIFVIHFLAVEFHFAIADIPAPVMGQRVVLTLKAVFVERV